VAPAAPPAVLCAHGCASHDVTHGAGTQTSLLRGPAAGAKAAPAALGPAAAQVWSALWTIYLVWGSTYLAIRVMVETVPPLLGAGVRFMLAGGAMVAFCALRRGWTVARPTRRQAAGALLVGLLLPGANAVVTVAEVDVPSGLAALLIGSVPLVLILLRTATGDRVAPASIAGVVLGFGGLAVLLLPGERPDGATLGGMLAIVGAAVMWATGSFTAPRLEQPSDPVAATGWQMLLGGGAIALAGVAAGEIGDVHPERFSGDSLWALAYLVLIGSVLAFTTYSWLLRNVRVSKVATYAYVNPAVAILLGWLILDETITATTLIGAAIIVAAVAVVVRSESRLA
jgi:drug/metabolite transporter (DMT)-like permease